MRDTQIAELGAEDDGVPVGPLHRPGQPCVLCHSAGGGAGAFSVAGTIYRDQRRATKVPVDRAEVLLLDAEGRTHRAPTNCAGNFFVRAADWRPTYPMWVTVRYGDEAIEMESPVHHDGSCAVCHTDPAGLASAGHIYLTDDPTTTIPAGDCSQTGARGTP